MARARDRVEAKPRIPPQLCETFGLQTQTTALAVSYFDQYHIKVRARGGELENPELVASVCVIIASKFLETKVPSMGTLCTMVGHGVSRESLRTAEMGVLRALEWHLHTPTPHTFLGQLVSLLELTEEPGRHFERRAEFMIDMASYVQKALEFQPVVVAAAAMMCSWDILGETELEKKHTGNLGQLCGHPLVRDVPPPHPRPISPRAPRPRPRPPAPVPPPGHVPFLYPPLFPRN